MTTPEKKKAKRLPLYTHYVFRDEEKDPVIDQIHTLLEDAGVSYQKAHELSGVSTSTLYNWIDGKTRRPQYCTIAAVAGGLGYELKFVKSQNVVSFKRRRAAA